MKIETTIRRNVDGVTRIYREEFNGDLRGARFWWDEGNGSCDCNRHKFFEKASDPDQNDDWWPCGDDSYTVLSVEEACSSSTDCSSLSGSET